SPRLADGDVGAGRKCLVESVQSDQVAPVVDDCDGSAGMGFLRLDGGGGDGPLRSVERQGPLIRKLRLCAAGRGDRSGGQYSGNTPRNVHVLSPVRLSAEAAGQQIPSARQPRTARKLLDRRGKRGFAEQHFRPRAPDLDLRDIVNVGRKDDLLVELI